MIGNIGKRVLEVRTRSGLSQTQFAERIKMNQSAISAIENGERLPTTENIISIANEFNVATDWLLIGQIEYQTPPTKADVIEDNEKGETWIGLAPAEQDIMNEIRNLPKEEVEDLKAYFRLKRRLGLQLTLSLEQREHQEYQKKQPDE